VVQQEAPWCRQNHPLLPLSRWAITTTPARPSELPVVTPALLPWWEVWPGQQPVSEPPLLPPACTACRGGIPGGAQPTAGAPLGWPVCPQTRLPSPAAGPQGPAAAPAAAPVLPPPPAPSAAAAAPHPAAPAAAAAAAQQRCLAPWAPGGRCAAAGGRPPTPVQGWRPAPRRALQTRLRYTPRPASCWLPAAGPAAAAWRNRLPGHSTCSTRSAGQAAMVGGWISWKAAMQDVKSWKAAAPGLRPAGMQLVQAQRRAGSADRCSPRRTCAAPVDKPDLVGGE
jgi:hypothetical protein